LGAIIVMVILTLSSCGSNGVRIEKTDGKDAEWHKTHFISGADKIIVSEQGIIVYGNNKVHLFDKVENNLKIGVPFVVIDHHSRIEYAIISTSNNMAKVRYASEFDHRSFGKKLITNDSGYFIVSSK
jgi:hypothetical protein